MDFRGSVKTTKFMHTILAVSVKVRVREDNFIQFSKGFGTQERLKTL